MVRTEGQNILKFLHALDVLKMNLNDTLQNEFFFQREMLNPNDEKYLVKIIGYKL